MVAFVGPCKCTRIIAFHVSAEVDYISDEDRRQLAGDGTSTHGFHGRSKAVRTNRNIKPRWAARDMDSQFTCPMVQSRRFDRPLPASGAMGEASRRLMAESRQRERPEKCRSRSVQLRSISSIRA